MPPRAPHRLTASFAEAGSLRFLANRTQDARMPLISGARRSRRACISRSASLAPRPRQREMRAASGPRSPWRRSRIGYSVSISLGLAGIMRRSASPVTTTETYAAVRNRCRPGWWSRLGFLIGGFILCLRWRSVRRRDGFDGRRSPRRGYPAYRNILEALGVEIVSIEIGCGVATMMVTADAIGRAHAEAPSR